MAQNNKVKVEITGDNKNLKKSFKDSEKVVQTSSKSMASMMGAAGKVMGAGFAAVALSGAALNKIMGEAVDLANIQEKEERKLEAVLRATGNAAGFSAQELKNLASQYQSVTTVGDETILSGMSILATFKNIRKEGFERATMAALDMSEVMGQDLNSSITQIGKALNDPIKGLSSLSRVGVTFTEQQKEQIKVLQESGEMYEAQSIILEELESQFGGVASAMVDLQSGALSQLGNTWGDVLEIIGQTETQNDDLTEAYKNLNTTLEDQADNIAALFSFYAEGKTIVVNLATEVVGLADDVRLVGAAFEAFRDLTRGVLTVKQYFSLDDADLQNYGKVRKALALIADTQRELTAERSKWLMFQDTEKIIELNEQLSYQQQWYNEILTDTSVEREKEIEDLKRLGTLYTPIIGLQKEQIESEILLGKVVKLTTSDQFEVMRVTKARGKATEKVLKEEAEAAEKAAKKRDKAEMLMYANLDDYSDDHKKLQLRLFDEEAKAYNDLGVKEGVVNRWRIRKQKDMNREFIRANGDFIDGVRLGYDELLEDQESWAESGIDVFETFADDAKNALSSNLFDVITGDFDDLGDAWSSGWNSMLQKMTDILAEMAIAWAAARVKDFVRSYELHDGAWNVGDDDSGLKSDEVPAILQMGEMVLPRGLASDVRRRAGQEANLNPMIEKVDEMGISREVFFEHLGDAFIADGLKGGAAISYGASSSSAFRGILSPANLGQNVFYAAKKTIVEEYGVPETAVMMGDMVGMAAAFAGIGPIAAQAIGVAVTVGVDALMDYYNIREMESVRDDFEMELGQVGGRDAWGDMNQMLQREARDFDNLAEYRDMPNPSDLGETPNIARFGGVFSGSESGYPMELHGTEAVVPLPDGKSIPVKIQGADKEGSESLLREIRAMRQELHVAQFQIAQNTGQSARLLKRWDGNGIPEERVLN